MNLVENLYDIIEKPILTEKCYSQFQSKRYAFRVVKNATKNQIKIAVETIFGVEVAKVNTLRVTGKIKRRGKYEGRTTSYKKAYVTLTDNSKAIEFFESLS
ncbi:MAG: 50S ribosomal protein L23 [Christensenellaceae bacterium]|jgi:large subunit ribosomal protein L23|nr:50S ribosomal protein L23 [Christensenellaceae bacterium]